MPQVAAAAIASAGTAFISSAATGAVAAAGAATASGVAISSGMAIAAGIANVSVAAVVASGVLGAASAGLQMLGDDKPKRAAPNASFRGGEGPLPVIYGTARVGGRAALYHANETAAFTKKSLETVWVLAAHEIDDVLEIWDGDKRMWSKSGGVDSDYVRSNGNARISVDVNLGASGQTPLPRLKERLPETLAGDVGDNFRLTGLPHVHVTFWSVAVGWPKGLPANLWFKVRGAKVLDPRDGQTRWTDNWALCVADYLKRQGGFADEFINEAALIAAANLCDEDVALEGGGTQKRYRLNGAIDTSMAARTVLPDLRAHAAAEMIWTGVDLLIRPGAYSAPVAIFGPDDFRGGLKISGQVEIENRFDGVGGMFVDGSAGFNEAESARIILDDYDPADGDPRVLEIPLAYETDSVRDQRLKLLNLRQTRRDTKIVVPLALTPQTTSLLPGERVTLQLPAIGLDGVFEVRRRVSVYDPANPRVEIEVLEDGTAFWTWTSDTATAPPPSYGSNLPDPSFVEPPTAVTVTANRRIETDGTTTRWLAVTWTASPDPFLDDYEVEWTQGGEVRSARTRATSYDIFGAGAAVGVTVRVRAVNTLGVESAWADAAGAVTPGGDVTPPGPPPSGTIVPIASGFRFRIGNPTDADLAGLRLYEGASGAAFGSCVAISDHPATPGGQPTEFTRTGLAPETTRRYFITAFDRSGNESLPYGPLEDATPAELTPEEVDAAIAGAVATAENAEAEAAAALAAALDRTTPAQAQAIADARIGVSLDPGGATTAAISAAIVDEETARIAGDTAVAGTVTALRARYEAGGALNHVRNSDFRLGTRHWWLAESAGYEYGVREAASVFSGPGDRPLFVRRIGGSADTAVLLYASTLETGYSTTAGTMPVLPGDVVEASANLGASNCSANIGIVWRTAAGALISVVGSASSTTVVSRDPAANPRRVVRATAPATAASASFVLNMLASVDPAADAFAILLRPMLCAAASGADPRPYVPSGPLDAASVDAYYRKSVAALAGDGVAVAQAVEAQGARLDDVEAAITVVETTKVDESGAVAAVNAQVSAGSGGEYATASDLAFAQADTTGKLSAARILGVDAGGNLAEIAIGATPTSSFLRLSAKTVEARADRFRVLNPDGLNPKTIFSVEGGQVVIDGALVLRGESVNTGQLTPSSVTKLLSTPAYVTPAARDVVNSVTLGSIVAPRAGSIMVLFDVWAEQLRSEAGTFNWAFRLKRNGVTVWNQTIALTAPFPLITQVITPTTHRMVSVSAGTHTFTVETENLTNINDGDQWRARGALLAIGAFA